MARQSLFTRDRAVYWPAEFVPIANFLKGFDQSGQPRNPAVYPFNTGVIVLAASLGVRHKRKREVGNERLDIMTSTFASHNLEGYIFLLPLIGGSSSGIELLDPENEEALIREFERYAAGGLEILRGMRDDAGGSAAEALLQRQLSAAMNNAGNEGLPRWLQPC